MLVAASVEQQQIAAQSHCVARKMPDMSEHIRSLREFRSLLRSVLATEIEDKRRDVVVLAIDGIPHFLARSAWPHARMQKLQSVFPTTSSSAWLSALTGLSVAQHGVPGVVFRLEDGAVVNVFDYQGPLGPTGCGNIFSDAKEIGYESIAITGDWHPISCSWLRSLLEQSKRFDEGRFFTGPARRSPEGLIDGIRSSLAKCLDRSDDTPRLVWCFVEVDRHVHMHGYDDLVIGFLEQIDALALEIVNSGKVVVAHSDHGLVRTRHNFSLERMLTRLTAEFNCVGGGAGRARWFYAPAHLEDRFLARLEDHLPASVRIQIADDVFEPGSLARKRVGNFVLTAESDDFVTFDGHIFDHGSVTETELFVPYAIWDD
jgi:hypothetical protein